MDKIRRRRISRTDNTLGAFVLLFKRHLLAL
jgi:hypothetical protein